MPTRPVGQTAQAGFQIGVRKTLPFTPDEIWSTLLSPEGTSIWLGGPVEIVQGAEYRLEDATSGRFTVYTPGSHVRLTWQPAGWDRPSVVQIRVIPAKTGTTLSFHQEHLAGPVEREAMKARWDRVIALLYLLIGDRTKTQKDPRSRVGERGSGSERV